MGKSFSAVFVSNYINHHQIPFCNAMYRLLEGAFTFIQTEPMEGDRVKMGWHEEERPVYVRLFYEEEEQCRRLILDSDMVLFGGTDEESYISGRLRSGRPVIRISERLYKTGQWKAVSPRGLRKKYHDHTRYRRARVYLLCAGAYVASDFHLVRAYPEKMYCWGYFPETRHYDIDRLLRAKGHGEVPYLLWAGRMIGWKHPELALETARYLKEKGLAFHMDMIGGGELRPEMEKLREDYGLQEYVGFQGFQAPEAVRKYMEKADIFLFTSDRQEGWGAVANEAMNSGCALVAGHRIGAVPFLVQNGKNGLIYEDGRSEHLFSLTERLVKDRALCRKLGKNAYETIIRVWNGDNGAVRLVKLMEDILREERDAGTLFIGRNGAEDKGEPADPAYGDSPYAPCGKAPVLSERGFLRMLRKTAREYDRGIIS